MKTINTSRELEPEMIYRMTREMGRSLVSKSAGATVSVADWIYYMDDPIKEGEEAREALSFMDGDSGEVFTTISPTFIRTFLDIIEIGIANPTIDIESGTTSKGREFYFAKLPYSK